MHLEFLKEDNFCRVFINFFPKSQLTQMLFSKHEIHIRRAVAQRCPDPPMVNLVTLGAQHQGVYGFPQCPGDNVKLCNYVRFLLSYGAYEQ